MSLLPIFSPTVAASVSCTASAVDPVDRTTYNAAAFQGLSFGTAASNRKLVVAVTGAVHTTATVSTMTIGGVSAALLAGTKVRYAGNEGSLELWQAAVPTGATGDVVVTWSGAQNRCGIGIFAVYNAAAALHAATTDNASPFSQSVAVPTGGVLIAALVGLTATSYGWDSPLVEGYDQEIESGVYHGGASCASAAGGNISVVMTPASGTTHAIAAVSFGPG